MNYLRIALAHWLAIVLLTVVCGGAAVGVSLLLPQYYSSEVALLIVQKHQQATDAYVAQRAAEKIGKNLTNIIQTFDFMNRVVATGHISPDTLSSSTEDRKKQWKKMVAAEMIPDTGVLAITAYGQDPTTAEDVVLGVMTVLTTNASDYYGGGDAFEIKHIDGPITSSRTVKPNLILNGLAAAALGAVTTYVFFLIRTEMKRSPAQPTAIQYQIPQQSLPSSTQAEALFPMPEVHYKVLDEYPDRPYVYGAELKDAPVAEAAEDSDDEEDMEDGDEDEDMEESDDANTVSMQDHIKS